MANTAIEEQRGGCVSATLSVAGIYRARLPSGPNGARLYRFDVTVGGCQFRLPNPAYCSVGAEALITIINIGTQTLTVTNYAGAPMGTVAPSSVLRVWQAASGVDSWLSRSSSILGSAQVPANRIPIELVYTASSTRGTHFLVDATRQFQYSPSQGPVALTVTVKAGVVLGQPPLINDPAYPGTVYAGTTTGPWPAGSTCLLKVEPGAYIQGAGGKYGLGRFAVSSVVPDPPLPGGPGGHALECLIDTVIINDGFIRGGGGGGGGASALSNSIPGGTGGGGAGAEPGAHYTSGTLKPTLESAGQGSQLPSGYAGGSGGLPGFPGNPGLGPLGFPVGAGGAGGAAIRRLSSVVVQQLGTGIYAGGTVII